MKRILTVVTVLLLASVVYAQSPLGGLIYLIKNTNGTTLYRGQIVTGDSLSTVLTTPYSVVKVAASSNFAIGTVYSDSILPNSLGWMTVSGAGYVAVLNTKVDSVIPKNRILYVSATAGLANCRVRTLFTGSAAQIGIPISKMIGRNVNLDSICIANILPTNVPDSGGVYKFGVILTDTVKAKVVQGSSGGAVRLVKQGSTADADTEFTIRDNGGTLLQWGDTLGNVYITTKVRGGNTEISASIIQESNTGSLLNLSNSPYIRAGTTGILTFFPATGCSLAAGGVAKADTLKAKVVAMAKDTSVEIASFGRTAIADTAAVITGVDSLIAAYILTPFATRAAITIPPSVSGVAATTNLLIIRRPAADTAAYDRYSIVKIRQR